MDEARARRVLDICHAHRDKRELMQRWFENWLRELMMKALAALTDVWIEEDHPVIAAARARGNGNNRKAEAHYQK